VKHTLFGTASGKSLDSAGALSKGGRRFTRAACSWTADEFAGIRQRPDDAAGERRAGPIEQRCAVRVGAGRVVSLRGPLFSTPQTARRQRRWRGPPKDGPSHMSQFTTIASTTPTPQAMATVRNRTVDHAPRLARTRAARQRKARMGRVHHATRRRDDARGHKRGADCLRFLCPRYFGICAPSGVRATACHLNNQRRENRPCNLDCVGARYCGDEKRR
jgi:hypothetical protein